MDRVGGVPSHDGYTKQCQIYNASGFGHRSLDFCPGCGPHAAAPLHPPDAYNAVKCGGCGNNVRTKNQPYDVIIVDEAQDLSPCQFDMLAQGVLPNSPHQHVRPGGSSARQRLRPTMYFIGDPCQQIFGWRGARANAFHSLFQAAAERNFTLKESFRFGPEVADIASRILYLKGMDVALTGRGPRAEVLHTCRLDWKSAPFHGAHVELWSGPGEEPETASLKELAERFRHQRRAGGWLQPFVVLCRTNKAIASILLHSALSLGGSLPKWFIKGKKKDLLQPSIMKQYVDLYNGRGCLKLKRSGPEFESWSELREWAEAGDSVDVLIKMSMVEDWEGSQGAGKLMEALEGAKQRSVGSEEDAELMLVTVHQAKGLEYPVVLLADDFQCPYIKDQMSGSFRLLLPEELATPHYKEESNLLYVAATRAQRV